MADMLNQINELVNQMEKAFFNGGRLVKIS